MVWHVRIHSEPKFALYQNGGASVISGRTCKALLQVTFPLSLTTDLSDAYYPLPALFYVQLLAVYENGQESTYGAEHLLAWKGARAGIRVVKAQVQQEVRVDEASLIASNSESEAGKLVRRLAIRVRADVSPSLGRKSQNSPRISEIVPEFLAVWTVPFQLDLTAVAQTKGSSTGFKPVGINATYVGEHWLQRRITVPGQSRMPPSRSDDKSEVSKAETQGPERPLELRILEEAGESIARHVWDGGLVVICHLFLQIYGIDNLQSTVEGTPPKPEVALVSNFLQKLRKQLSLGEIHQPRILELGAGCGTVGLALAKLFPGSKILLTDLPEAMNIMDANIRALDLDKGTESEIGFLELDWDSVLQDTSNILNRLQNTILGNTLDLIVLSDCTYNEDTFEVLVETLHTLTVSKQIKSKGSSGPAILVIRKPRHESEEVFFSMMEKYFTATDAFELQIPEPSKTDTEDMPKFVQVFTYLPN